MSKVKVMKFHQTVMAIIGLYPYPLTESKYRAPNLISPFVMCPCLGGSIVLSALYAYQGSEVLSFVLDAVIIFIGESQALAVYLNMRQKIDMIGNLNQKLQEIVDQGSDQWELASIYRNAEQKSQQFTKTLASFLIFQQLSFIIALLLSIYSVCIENFDTATYILPLRVAAPYPIDTVLAWYSFYLMQWIFGMSYMFVFIPVTSYFVCNCIYLQALCDHFDSIIKRVNAEFYEEQSDSNELTVRCRNSIRAKKLFCNAIDLHVKMMEVFDMCADINSGTIFIFLPIGALFLGISLYNLEHSNAGFTSEGIAAVGYALLCVYCAMMWSFLLCFYGTFATERVRSVDTMIFNANWMDFPSDLRKYVVVIIAQSRSTGFFNGFSLISCTLEAFAKICRSSGSYYVVFRRFAQR